MGVGVGVGDAVAVGVGVSVGIGVGDGDGVGEAVAGGVVAGCFGGLLALLVTNVVPLERIR